MVQDAQDATWEPAERASSWVTVATSPLVWVLSLAAFFDGISDNWVHAALLSAVAVAVARDTVLTNRGIELPESYALFGERPSTWFVAGLASVALVYAVVAGSLTRYSWPMTLAILLPGVTMLLIGWGGALLPRARSTDRSSPRPWLIVLVLLGLWELSALLSQPNLQTDSEQHPTISVLMNPVLASHLGRSIALFVWLVAGWYILSRAPAKLRQEQPA